MRATVLPSLTLLFSLVFAPLTVQAAAAEYDIEVLIFEDIYNRYINSERWPRLEVDLSADELPAGYRQSPYTHSAAGKIRNNKVSHLTNEAKKIRSSKNYRILAHKAWRQAGLDTDNAFYVPVNSSNESGSRISGGIKVALERYLHVYTDLTYSKPRNTFSATDTMGSVDRSSHKDFSIKDRRRMRSREIHYLDHPLVGMLVIAIPVE